MSFCYRGMVIILKRINKTSWQLNRHRVSVKHIREEHVVCRWRARARASAPRLGLRQFRDARENVDEAGISPTISRYLGAKSPFQHLVCRSKLNGCDLLRGTSSIFRRCVRACRLFLRRLMSTTKSCSKERSEKSDWHGEREYREREAARMPRSDRFAKCGNRVTGTYLFFSFSPVRPLRARPGPIRARGHFVPCSRCSSRARHVGHGDKEREKSTRLRSRRFWTTMTTTADVWRGNVDYVFGARARVARYRFSSPSTLVSLVPFGRRNAPGGETRLRSLLMPVRRRRWRRRRRGERTRQGWRATFAGTR